MTAPTAVGWDDYFVALAGVAAALAGLLFVAASINLTRILSFPYLPDRAAETLALLFALLVVALFGLVPAQPTALLGVEIGTVGVLILALASRLQAQGSDDPHRHLLLRVCTVQGPALLLLAAGASLLTARGPGLYLTVPAVALGLAGTGIHAWVLLVEIHR